MKINFDINNGTVEPFTILLSTRDHRHLGEILNIKNMQYTNYLNSAPKICFTVFKIADGIEERLWDDITDLKLIYVIQLHSYFEITISVADSDSTQKSITGNSVCECELSQKMLYNVEINTEIDIERSDYVPALFYNQDSPETSLLNRVLKEMPAYSIKHVDSSLAKLQRSFSIDNKSIYDFLTGECADEFNCLFQFNSVDRSISVYDLYAVCKDCGHRGPFNNTCPKCGKSNIKYFGNDTTILVSADNLTDEVQLETDTDQIKNCFWLEAGDDIVTAAAMSYIPSGGRQIFYFSEDQIKDMPPEIAGKIKSYNVLYDSQIESYNTITKNIYECIERITYYTSKQMPEVTIPNVTASSEATKLTVSRLSPLSLSILNQYTSTSTINSALLNYAKVYVRSGFVKIEVDTGNFRFNGTSNGISTGIWTGRFKITNYSNKEDVAYSSTLTLIVDDDYQSFMNEKILKNIASNNTDDNSVYDVLNIKDTSSFSNAIKLYGLKRLISFRDAINGVLSILQEAGGGRTDSELYIPFYTHYYNKLTACNDEIKKRKDTIQEWEQRKDTYEKQKEEIQKTLDFKKYIGEDSYKVFTTYIREDKYVNSNYISDGLSDDGIFKRAQEFIEKAQQELITASTYQHSIRTNLYNLLLLEEFAPIVDHFELGNWIRVQADEEIYRLRLISYEIDFDDLTKLNTEFSDVTKTAEGMFDTADILKQADSMAKSYSYVATQASNGHKAEMTLDDMRKEGLDSALYAIKNADSEEITFGKNGLLARSYDDITDSYSDEQLILTHNILAYTTDGMRSIRAALGKMKLTVDGSTHYEYGLNADFCISSKIIAGNIYSANYSSTAVKGTRLNLDNGTFTIADGKIVFDGNKLKIKGVEIDWSTTNESANMWASINANASSIASEIARATGAENVLSTSITQTADQLRLEAKNIKEGLEASITTTAGAIRTEVSQNYETKAGAQAQYNNLSSSISQTAQAITTEVSRATSAEGSLSTQISQTANQIVLKANANGKIVQAALSADPSTGTEFKVTADNISLSANEILNLMAGGTLNLTASGISITSNNFSVDSQGNMSCNSINTFAIKGNAVQQFNNAVLDSKTIADIKHLIAVLDQRVIDLQYSQPLTVSGDGMQSPSYIYGYYNGKYDLTNVIGITITYEYYYNDKDSDIMGDPKKYYYNTYEVGVGVSNNKATFNSYQSFSFGNLSYDTSAKGTKSQNVDVSSLKGEYYIGARIRGYNSNTNGMLQGYSSDQTYYVKIVNIQTF